MRTIALAVMLFVVWARGQTNSIGLSMFSTPILGTTVLSANVAVLEPATNSAKISLAWPRVPDEVAPQEICLVEVEKVVWPRLYYVHQCVDYKPEEGTDVFGRIVKLSSRVHMVCPLCIWDSPTAVTERVMVGTGLFWEFR